MFTNIRTHTFDDLPVSKRPRVLFNCSDCGHEAPAVDTESCLLCNVIMCPQCNAGRHYQNICKRHQAWCRTCEVLYMSFMTGPSWVQSAILNRRINCNRSILDVASLQNQTYTVRIGGKVVSVCIGCFVICDLEHRWLNKFIPLPGELRSIILSYFTPDETVPSTLKTLESIARQDV